MFCTKCAAEIKDESANFCQNCAAPVVRVTTEQTELVNDAGDPSQETAEEQTAEQPAEVVTPTKIKQWDKSTKVVVSSMAGLLLVALVIGLITGSLSGSSSSSASTDSGCVALETNINQSTGPERVKFLKLASEKGCNIQAKPAPTTGTVSLPPMATWYPKGYNEYGDGLAWKWTDESCGYSSGYCWTMRVKTRDGCADGIYAEANIEQKGVVIGYTNDTLGSLRPGATAKLAFTHFGGSGTLSASLTKITCYNYSL